MHVMKRALHCPCALFAFDTHVLFFLGQISFCWMVS